MLHAAWTRFGHIDAFDAFIRRLEATAAPAYSPQKNEEAFSQSPDRETWASLIALFGPERTLHAAIAWFEGHDALPLAVQLVEAWIQARPDEWKAKLHLSRLRLKSGKPEEAADLAIGLIRARPEEFWGYAALGDVRMAQGRAEEAIAAFARVLNIYPDHTAALVNLGSLLLQQRRHTEAQPILQHLLAIAPEDPDGQANLAALHLARGEAEAGLSLSLKVLGQQPNHFPALINAAGAYIDLARPQAALALLENHPEIAARPEIANLRSKAHQAIGRADLALRAMAGQAILTNAQVADLQSALLHEPSATARDVVKIADRLPTTPVRHCLAERSAGDRQHPRIGLHSADFRSHAMGFFLPPLMRAARDLNATIHCYSGVTRPDHVTRECRALADAWRDIGDISDHSMLDVIASDGLDILIDCAGASRGARIDVFRHRPAPIQATWILGWGAPTGRDCFDHILSDRHLTPERNWEGGEDLAVMEWAVAPFRPNPAWPDPVETRHTNRTYGCFAQPARLSHRTLETWRTLFEEDRTARLLLWHPGFAHEDDRAYWNARLGEYGLDGRFVLSHPGVMDMGTAYGATSVILDTFPVTGATTSLIALWMGRPMVTLAGKEPWQRFGLEILNACGMDDWIATDSDGFVAAAIMAASQPAAIGGELRDLLADSPLLNAPARAADFVAACSEMIKNHRASP